MATPTVLEKAKVSLVTTHPFFASILMKRTPIADNTIKTAAVDQRGQIYYNPEFVESLTVQQATFLLAHEVGHVIGQHAARRGSRDPKRWNYAGDAWINDMLKAADVGEVIDGCVDIDGSRDKSVDEIYNNLPDNPDDGGGIGDDLIERGEPVTQDELARIDAETRVDIAQAAQAAKAVGRMPNALSDIVADLIASHTPWYDILERYMVSFTRGDYSWSRPNRRFAPTHYLPTVGTVARMGDVVIQVDVSGSVSQREVDHYNGHIARIVEMCSPERVHVLYTDTSVQRHDVFEVGETPFISMYSGGGTDMESGFAYCADNGITPDVFVCLTDGYTDFTSPPDFPVVWCISTDVVASYGDTIKFEVNQ